MKTLIVDDEPLARLRLQRQLEQCPGVQVVGEAATAEQAWQLVAELQPQLLLLDIAMPAANGIELADRLRGLDQTPLIIFTTAYEEHALAAYERAAIDYLVKPVRLQRLREALQRAQRYLAGEAAEPRWIKAKVGGRTQLISLQEVSCCVAEDKYTTVHYSGGQTVIDLSLARLEQDYADYFLRIHRGALVARPKLRTLDSRQGRHWVRLQGCEMELEVSRRHLPELRRFLKEHT
ncbi:MAG: LytTR family DNA-binding domain-containing protein [Wenzhouxiangellaceae bacterium]